MEGPTECSTKIILPQRRLRCPQVIAEPVIRIENAIAEVIVGSAVPLFRTGFCLKRKLAARVPAEFGRLG
jgi:hypothetical protein